MWADGAGITKIVHATGKTKRTAYRWRDRYVERAVEGLRRDASRPGRKKPLDAATVERVVQMTLHEKPPRGTHWSARKLAAQTPSALPFPLHADFGVLDQSGRALLRPDHRRMPSAAASFIASPISKRPSKIT